MSETSTPSDFEFEHGKLYEKYPSQKYSQHFELVMGI